MRTNLVAATILLLAACSKKDPPPAPPPPPPTVDRAKVTDDKLIAEAKQFVKDADPKLRKLLVDASLAEWTNETDITKEHEAATAKASEIQSVEITKMVKAARRFDPILDKLDPDTKRQLLLLKFQAQPAPDDAKQATELATTAAAMQSTYGKGVCTSPSGQTGDGKEPPSQSPRPGRGSCWFPRRPSILPCSCRPRYAQLKRYRRQQQYKNICCGRSGFNRTACP